MLYHYSFVISAGENVNYNVKLIKSNRKNYDNGTQGAKQRPYYIWYKQRSSSAEPRRKKITLLSFILS